MNEDMIIRILREAEQAEFNFEWESAIELYQSILRAQPQNTLAEQGLRRSQNLKQLDSEINDLIQQARTSQANEEYEAAFNLYDTAERLGGRKGLYKYQNLLGKSLIQIRELQTWHKRVSQLENLADAPTTLTEIENLLQQIPRDPLFEPFAARLQTLRTTIEDNRDHQEFVPLARKAMKDLDFVEALRLIDLAKDHLAGAAKVDAERTRGQILNLQKRLPPALQRAEQATENGEWAVVISELEQSKEALIELDPLQRTPPISPTWRRLYVGANLVLGQKALERGELAIQQREWAEAERSLLKAEQAFSLALQLKSDLPDIAAKRSEAEEAARLTAAIYRIEKSYENSEYEQPLQLIEEALNEIGRARVEGRYHLTLEAALAAIRREIKQEQASLLRLEQELQRGGQFYRAGDLAGAREAFNRVINDTGLPPKRTEALKAKAREGLKYVEGIIAQFNAAMDAAAQTKNTSPVESAENLQKAYELWPTGPGIAEQLEQSLIAAAKAALETGRTQEAAKWAGRVLALNEYNPEALTIQRSLELLPRTNAAIDEARTASGRRGEALLDEIHELIRLADHDPRLKEKLALVDTDLQRRLEQEREYLKVYKQAVDARQAGQWEKAVDALESARHLPHPNSLEVELENSRVALSAVRGFRTSVETGWQQFESGYSQARQPADFSKGLESLRAIEGYIQQADKPCRDAQGALPIDLAERSAQVQRAIGRLNTILSALRDPAISGTLALLRGIASADKSEDATLQALLKLQEERGLAEVPILLDQARTHIDTGNWIEADDKLRAAREIQPNNLEVFKLKAIVERQQLILRRIRDAETQYDTLLNTNSRKEAYAQLTAGLKIFLEPEVLPAEMRNTLGAMLDEPLRDESVKSVEDWRVLQNGRLEKLRTLSIGKELPNQCYRLALNWLNSAHDKSLQGVISSQEAYGNLLEAYAAAQDLANKHTDDLHLLEQARNRFNSLIQTSNTSAQKRVSRAQEYLSQGLFSSAIAQLQEIERIFYQPIETRFPTILEGLEAVARIRADAQDLLLKSEHLNKQSEEVAGYLQSARTALFNNQFEEAYKSINNAQGYTKYSPVFETQINEILTRVQDSQRMKLHQELAETLNVARNVLNGANDANDLKAQSARLHKWRKSDLDLLPSEDRNSYQQMLTALKEADENFKRAKEAETQAKKDLESGNVEGALSALTDALSITRAGEKRFKLERQIAELQHKVEQVRARQVAESRGIDHLREKNYAEARQEFRRAKDLGLADADLWLKATAASALLSNARDQWQTHGNWDEAQMNLEEALRLATNNPQAPDLLGEIKLYQQFLSRQREQATRREKALNKARRALAEGQLDKASEAVNEVLDALPTQQEAQKLRDEINRRVESEQQLTQAQLARAEGRLMDALSHIEATLIGFPQNLTAIALKNQLLAEKKQTDALALTENYIEQNRFVEARQSLGDAAGVAPERLALIHRKIAEGEAQLENSILGPLQRLKIEEKFSEAYERGRIVQTQAGIPVDLLAKLAALLQEIVNSWAEKTLASLRGDLATADENDLERLMINLERLLGLTPKPTSNFQTSLTEVHTQAIKRRWRLRLEKAAQYFENGQWVEARNLALEVETQTEHEQVLAGVYLAAVTLQNQINDAQEAEAAAREATARRTALDDGWHSLNIAATRDDYERARNSARTVLALQRYSNDTEAIDLLARSDHALQILTQTDKALNESRRFTRQRDLLGAETVLALPDIAPLRQKTLIEHREALRWLRAAAEAEREIKWVSALQAYRQAVDLDAELATIFKPDIEQCERNITQAIEKYANEFETALRAANFEQAAEAVYQAREYAPPGDERPIQLAQALYARGLTAIEQLKPSGQYAATLRIASIISGLNFIEVDSQLYGRLTEERQQKIEAALAQANASLQNDDLASTGEQLRFAAALTAPQSDSRVEAIQQRLSARQIQLVQLDAQITTVRELITQQAWEKAVDNLLTVRAAAPNYHLARKLQSDFIETSLMPTAEAELSKAQFTAALQICQQALRLDSANPTVRALEQRILATRAERLNQYCAQAQQAIERWDLKGARRWLTDADSLLPNNPRVNELRARLSDEQQANEIQTRMNEGYQNIVSRNYIRAGEVFARLYETFPTFGEAELWRDYAANLNRAISLVEAEKFGEAVQVLFAAESLLHIGISAILPEVWGGDSHLRARRRQAAYDAFRLRKYSHRLQQLNLQQAAQLDNLSRLPIIEQLIADKEGFVRVYHAQELPPDTYSIESPLEELPSLPLQLPSESLRASSPVVPEITEDVIGLQTEPIKETQTPWYQRLLPGLLKRSPKSNLTSPAHPPAPQPPIRHETQIPIASIHTPPGLPEPQNPVLDITSAVAPESQLPTTVLAVNSNQPPPRPKLRPVESPTAESQPAQTPPDLPERLSANTASPKAADLPSVEESETPTLSISDWNISGELTHYDEDENK